MEVDRAARLSALKSHPSWPELLKEVAEVKERYIASLSRQMLATGKPFDDFEYKRGFLAGMEHLTRYPEGSTRILEREARRVEKLKEQDAGTNG